MERIRDVWADHKDEWRRRGQNFCVTVERFNRYDGKNGWAYYVFVYQKHPLFESALRDTRVFGAGQLEEHDWHGGITCKRIHRSEDGNQITSIQVGADFAHLYDDRFASMTTPDEAYEVFNAAGELWHFMDAHKGSCDG